MLHAHYELVGGVAGSYSELWMICKPALISGMVGIFRVEDPGSGYEASINRALVLLAGVAMGTMQVYAIEVIAVAVRKSQQQHLRVTDNTISPDDFSPAQPDHLLVSSKVI